MEWWCRSLAQSGPLSGHLKVSDVITMVDSCVVTDSADWLNCLTRMSIPLDHELNANKSGFASNAHYTRALGESWKPGLIGSSAQILVSDILYKAVLIFLESSLDESKPAALVMQCTNLDKCKSLKACSAVAHYIPWWCRWGSLCTT